MAVIVVGQGRNRGDMKRLLTKEIFRRLPPLHSIGQPGNSQGGSGFAEFT